MQPLAIIHIVFICWIMASGVAVAQPAPSPCSSAPQYGNSPDGRFANVNGISIYYETYGEGQPLLLIHGNGGSIDRDRCQIAYFSRFRRVIIADSRSHGRSENGPGRLTYEQIADDLSALLTELKIEKTDVWGHSDGGIVALLLGIRHPSQIGKLVASSANLSPDALPPETLARPRQLWQEADAMIKAGDRSQDWARVKQQKEMVLQEPHITSADLQKISSPTLVIGADFDDIPVRHFVEIRDAIPHAQLFIMPGATHGMIRDEPSDLYNSVVARFLETASAQGGQTITISLPFFTPMARDPRNPILGVWRGPVSEGAKQYGMEILLEHLIVGEPAGRILFYGLGSENWTVGSSLVLRERNADGVYVFCSTKDVSRGCGGGANDGQVHLRLLDDEQLQYVEPGPGPAPASMGILERKVGGR